MSLSRNDSFAGTLIILEHPAAVYRFSRALDIYHMRDARFYDFSTYLDIVTFINVFNENFDKALLSDRSIITMPYTSLMAKVLEVCLDKYFKDYLDSFLCLTFLNSNAVTEKIYLTTGESAISYKLNLLRGLASFPYIKKVEIPFNCRLTYPFIYRIIEAVIKSGTP
jgi:hypothetical protein